MTTDAHIMLNEATPFAWQEFDSASSASSATTAEDSQLSLQNSSLAYLVEDGAGITFNASKTRKQGLNTQDTHLTAKGLYSNLADGKLTRQNKLLSQQYLIEKLQAVQQMESDLPTGIDSISAWIEHNNEQVGQQYRQYLDARKSGAARRFFTTKAHALNFLRCVAPTKLVDGAWLYGFTRQWDDARFSALTRIYLEELGEGMPDKNHVTLYKKLLSDNQCGQWEDLPEQHFIQGAIQLALGYNTEEFMPEAIGFNLGYEQLPLHLLITAYELNELGIDPYYFTLHVTVDNASTGHARQSLQALMDSTPIAVDRQAFMQRVVDGYKLNQLGLCTTDIISSFDLQQEFIDILATKSTYGKNMHSDYCRINGRTVNEWLSDKALIPQFIDSLVDKQWIVRHQDPQESRFWKLLQSEKAEMFGVFNAYELQVIYDWIAGDALDHGERRDDKKDAANASTFPPRQYSFRMRQQRATLNNQTGKNRASDTKSPVENKLRERRLSARTTAYSTNDDHYQPFDPDVSKLQETIATMQDRDDILHLLVGFLSPAMHHTPVGLLATRLYIAMLDGSARFSPSQESLISMSDAH